MTLNFMLVSLFATIIASYFVTKLVMFIVYKIEILDTPDYRKIHKFPVALLGGVAIFFTFFMALSYAFHFNIDFMFAITRQRFFGLFLGSSIILLLGIFDDLYGSSAKLKFIVQGIAAVVAFFYGFRVEFVTNPFGGVIEFDLFTELILTIFWIVALTNAINLLDGLDGLATGVCSIACVSLFIVAVYRGDITSSFITLLLFASCVGFLFFNLYPAKIFLGDTGSLLLGYILALLGIVSINKSVTAISLIMPIAALSIPLYDTFLAIVRRTKKKKNIFKADREHIHHRLLNVGLSHRAAVMLLYFVSIYFGFIAYLAVLIPKTYSLLLFIVFIISLITGLWVLNNAEFKMTFKRKKNED